MPDLTAKRTLVKSPPELWSELSDMERLARHLGAFGEIKITKLEPEHTVAWEGEAARGTVSIEPSGWGTKVTLTAQLEGEAPVAEARPLAEAVTEDVAEPPAPPEEPAPPLSPEEPAPSPVSVEEPPPPAPEEAATPAEEPAPQRKRGFFAWLFRPRSGAQDSPVVEPEAVKEAPELVGAPLAVEPATEPVAFRPDPVAAAPIADEPAPEPPSVASDPAPQPLAAEADSSNALDPEHAQAILDDALEALGSAHHRPFSRG